MRAMLLCAGLGTRLGTLSDTRPKPMLPVCDHPILAFGIANLVAHDIVDLVINLHHRGDAIRDAIGDGRRFGARVTYIDEPVILGVGGGLKNALHLLDPDHTDEPFLSLNGKLIFDVDLHAVVHAHRAAGDVLGTMVVRRVPDAGSWGAVRVATDDRGPHVTDVLGDGEHMFCGVHVTRRSVVSRLPDGEACMIRQGYLPWLRAGERVAAYEHSRGYFAEHSTPERYLASNLAILTEALRHPPSARLRGIDPTARVHPDAWLVEPLRIGPNATIGAKATIANAVIGAGARIAAGVTIERAVVWPGVVVEHDVTDVVVSL